MSLMMEELALMEQAKIQIHELPMKASLSEKPSLTRREWPAGHAYRCMGQWWVQEQACALRGEHGTSPYPFWW